MVQDVYFSLHTVHMSALSEKTQVSDLGPLGPLVIFRSKQGLASHVNHLPIDMYHSHEISSLEKVSVVELTKVTVDTYLKITYTRRAAYV